MKYVALNLVALAVLLVTIGVIYGLTGTVNLADLSLRMADVEPGLAAGLAAMLLIAFGIKAALVPLFFWLPASYHMPPVAVSASSAACSRRSASMPSCGCSRCSSPSRRPTSSRCC